MGVVSRLGTAEGELQISMANSIIFFAYFFLGALSKSLSAYQSIINITEFYNTWLSQATTPDPHTTTTRLTKLQTSFPLIAKSATTKIHLPLNTLALATLNSPILSSFPKLYNRDISLARPQPTHKPPTFLQTFRPSPLRNHLCLSSWIPRKNIHMTMETVLPRQSQTNLRICTPQQAKQRSNNHQSLFTHLPNNRQYPSGSTIDAQTNARTGKLSTTSFICAIIMQFLGNTMNSRTRIEGQGKGQESSSCGGRARWARVSMSKISLRGTKRVHLRSVFCCQIAIDQSVGKNHDQIRQTIFSRPQQLSHTQKLVKQLSIAYDPCQNLLSVDLKYIWHFAYFGMLLRRMSYCLALSKRKQLNLSITNNNNNSNHLSNPYCYSLFKFLILPRIFNPSSHSNISLFFEFNPYSVLNRHFTFLQLESSSKFPFYFDLCSDLIFQQFLRNLQNITTLFSSVHQYNSYCH